jgi:hypothetical protein
LRKAVVQPEQSVHLMEAETAEIVEVIKENETSKEAQIVETVVLTTVQ